MTVSRAFAELADPRDEVASARQHRSSAAAIVRESEARNRRGSARASGVDSGPEWLIDNADAYAAVLDAIAGAQRSVWIMQLAFDADCVAYTSSDARAEDTSPARGTTALSSALLDAVCRAPVEVRILLNATILMDTTRALRRFLDSRLRELTAVRGSIRVRGVSRFPHLLHAKMVIVDSDEAFLLGSPFANGYWDETTHPPVDTRRPARELGGRPLHDVSLCIRGHAVADLARIFADLWALEGNLDVAAPRDNDDDVATVTPSATDVRVVSTAAPNLLRHAPQGTTEILDAMLDGIAGARSFIYIEHQYLSSRPIIAALTRALKIHAHLELIVVLNQNPDITAYRRWQNARLAEAGLLTHPRAGVFALWSAAHAERATQMNHVQLNHVFVHSKVIAIDDRWASAGSANLDGVSLHSYGDDFTGRFARWLFRPVRNLDVNIVVNHRVDDAASMNSARRLRMRLWSEHLGMPAASLADCPASGWLPLWRACAHANIRSLNDIRSDRTATPPGAPAMKGFVLPYSVQPTPARQLADVGVHVDPATLDVRFNPSWVEVQFNPQWIRNMFT